MAKAVSNTKNCLIKAVLLLCKHGHFFLNFASHGVNIPLRHTIRGKKKDKLSIEAKL